MTLIRCSVNTYITIRLAFFVIVTIVTFVVSVIIKTTVFILALLFYKRRSLCGANQLVRIAFVYFAQIHIFVVIVKNNIVIIIVKLLHTDYT